LRQDSWKVTPKAAPDLGVRYSVIVPYHALWGNMIVFDAAVLRSVEAVTIDPKTGLIVGTIDPKTACRSTERMCTTHGHTAAGFSEFSAGRVPEADRVSSISAGCSAVSEPLLGYPVEGVFQPRLGIAYALNSKTVIRAGAAATLRAWA